MKEETYIGGGLITVLLFVVFISTMVVYSIMHEANQQATLDNACQKLSYREYDSKLGACISDGSILRIEHTCDTWGEKCKIYSTDSGSRLDKED